MGGIHAAMVGARRLLSVTVSPDPTTGIRAGAGLCVSDPATGTGSGGTPGYTYAWTHVSGDAGITINSPAAASTTFQKILGAAPDFTSAVKRCTVTDATSQTATYDVTVELSSV